MGIRHKAIKKINSDIFRNLLQLFVSECLSRDFSKGEAYTVQIKIGLQPE